MYMDELSFLRQMPTCNGELGSSQTHLFDREVLYST